MIEEEQEEEDDHVEIDEDFSFSAHKQDRPSAPEKELTDGPRIFDPYADRVGWPSSLRFREALMVLVPFLKQSTHHKSPGGSQVLSCC